MHKMNIYIYMLNSLDLFQLQNTFLYTFLEAGSSVAGGAPAVLELCTIRSLWDADTGVIAELQFRVVCGGLGHTLLVLKGRLHFGSASVLFAVEVDKTLPQTVQALERGKQELHGA